MRIFVTALMVFIGSTYIPIIGNSSEGNISDPDEPPSTMLIYEGIAIASVIPVYYDTPEELALLVLRDKIIQCESGGSPTAQNAISTAHGLCQFLDSTWANVQDRWKMTLERDSYEDQLYACTRLLEEDGTRHWLESQYCWQS